ncbi:MAG: transcriptional regulator NrdR, partial [Leptolyngbyaceae cyanobacterium RM2_2_21]|nr:transcriptional regulator NrdR [Leptolyngbyaceae cyanobacterium RM2_2_21]
MQCPFCQHTDNRVLESRAAESGRSIRRRRECLRCSRRFTTYERIEQVPITVIKR